MKHGCLVLLLALFTQGAWAHGGGLDKHGCHTNRKTGDYHCHRGAANPQPTPRANDKPNNLAPPSGASAERSGSRPFRNCAEARAAGAVPVHRGDPGYGPHLDQDDDGVGCEPYRGR
jgi:hypothetical protein